ncbi:perivitellin-2 67 kDa subunit-like [Tetranychus urticae]|uniref:perivitellin-2 67 kDa subunit-like n=1 Tax=Tetranychus urticae TaxID=32264 RepID=UPI00077BE43E|nr:perivitellin-2 67 kDa subunit-like [Tetranychus urticae]XP_025016882.1 perivitellin-2 67 kDa subunit-like [Tetranychus urticae]
MKLNPSTKLLILTILSNWIWFTLAANNSSKSLKSKDNINYFDGSLLKENQFHFASAKDELCGLIVPGLQMMTRGVDITKLDLLHDYTADNDDGFARCSFIELTCKKKRKFFLAGAAYDVPDQVLSIDLLPRETIKTHFSIISSLEEIKSEFKMTSGMDEPLNRGAFSKSASYKTYQSILLNNTKTIASLQLITPTTRINLAPRTSLRKSLSEFMEDFMSEELPGRYEEAPEKYLEFIENYGTHYFKSALFGGVFKYLTQIDTSKDKEDSKPLTDADLTKSINNYFMSLLSRKGVVSKVFEKKENKAFREKLATNQSYYGGDAFLLEVDRYENWLPTVPRNPWLVNGQFGSITELIRNETIRNELNKAIEVHMGLAYISELIRLATNQMNKFPNKLAKTGLLLEKIDKMLKFQIPSLDQVKVMIKELESLKFISKLIQI